MKWRVVFYNETYTKAAVIMCRMFSKNQEAKLKVETKFMLGNGFELTLLPNQTLVIFFISKN